MPAANPCYKNTCAVIVSYHPDITFPARVELAQIQFAQVIIVDNGSGIDALAILRELETSGVHVVRNQKNQGIATALNQGLLVAQRQKFEWAVLLDQDTLISPSMLSGLANVVASLGSEKILVGSNYRDEHSGRNFAACENSNAIGMVRKTLITSGTLMCLEMIKEVGEFRDDYFIDSVDHEYCLRARKHGYRVVISCQVLMTQRIGSERHNRGRRHRYMSFNHAPIRKYFIARNTIITARTYFRQEKAWSFRQAWRLANDLVSILIFEDNKAKKLKAFGIGIIHGLAGKTGSIDKTWPNAVL